MSGFTFLSQEQLKYCGFIKNKSEVVSDYIVVLGGFIEEKYGKRRTEYWTTTVNTYDENGIQEMLTAGGGCGQRAERIAELQIKDLSYISRNVGMDR